MGLCESGALDFTNACTRDTWASIPAAALVVVFCLLSLPIKLPARVRKLGEPFKTFLTLHEAEALDVQDERETVEVSAVVPLWRTVVFALLGLVEALGWAGEGSYRIVIASDDVWSIVRPFLISLTWLYTVVRPVASPTATPPYDVFVLYILHLVGGTLMLGGAIYESTVYGVPLPHGVILVGLYANLLIVVALLAVVMSMPIGVPSSRVKKSDIVSSPILHIFHGLCLKVFMTGQKCLSRGLYHPLRLDHIQLGLPSCPERKEHDTQ